MMMTLLLFAVTASNSFAQNLAPNPDLEYYTQCPTGYEVPGPPPLMCAPWISAAWGTTDYFNACANPNDIGVPDNDNGWQPAVSGEGYCGFMLKATIIDDYREYLQGPLVMPLLGGKWYYVSFYVSLANEWCGIQQIGAYFSATPPPATWAQPIMVTPQVETPPTTFYGDTANWMFIEGCFRAIGGEAIITIGNFHSNATTPIDPTCTTYPLGAYYYIDDIYVGEVQPGDLDLELGGPLSDCYSVTIDPGISGVDFYWEGGSNDPTLTVTASGTYNLTIYDGCRAGVDSVEVFITDAPPVDLNPEEISICQGETFTFPLDPDVEEYTWEDGSHESEYVISTTGFYWVTLDDGCDITSDGANVIVVQPPPPFTLGADTTICTGAQIVFEFDAGLGDFLWQDNSTSEYYVINSQGYYALTITNMCGEESAEVEVSEVDPVYVSIGPNADTLCSGELLIITLDPAGGTYVWQDGSTEPMYQINSTGVYSVTMTNFCGPSVDSVTVLALTTPSFDLGDTINTCPGESWTIAITNYIGEYTWQDGSDTNFIVVTTSGTYSLTIENACGIDSGDIVMVYADTLESPDLGPDFTLCPGEEVILNAGNLGIAYTWQDLSSADTLLVNAAGTYHVAVSNGCETLSDTVVVTLANMPPLITMPDQLTLCQGNSEVLDPGVSGVAYDWSNGTHDPTLTVSVAGTYSLTVTNTCGSDVDTVIVIDGGQMPTIDLGMDVSVCTGEVINIVPVSSNVSAWLWPDGSMNATYTTSSAGPVYVEVSNGCGVAYDTMQVALLPLTPPLSLGPDLMLCPGDTVILTISESNVDILWSNGTTNPDNYVTDTATQVSASITNGCASSVDTVNISLLPATPPLDLGDDQSLCPGEVIVFDPGIAGVAYVWQDGSTGSSYQTTQQVVVVLVISNVCGTSTDTAVVVESTDGPMVDLGPDVHACEGETITIPSGISGVTYLWQDGSNANEYSATASGWVHLTVTNLCGTDIDSVLVDINGVVPAPDLGPDTTLCEGESIILTSTADANTTIEWQDGASSQNYLVTLAGTYTLTETNQCGTATDDVLVSINLLPQSFSLGLDTTLCTGGSFFLTAPVTSDELRWQDGSDQATMLVDQAGTFSLQVSNLCGVETDEVVVTMSTDVPLLSLTSPIPWCPGDQVTLNATQSFAANYLWSTGQTVPSIVVVTPGIYSIEVFAPCNTASGLVEVIAMNDCNPADDIYIPNVFSPNDDQINDVFRLSTGPDVVLTNLEGSIYDRWGNLVYFSDAIPFAWDGRFDGEVMMPGVYVYHLKVKYTVGRDEKEKLFTGDLTVVK